MKTINEIKTIFKEATGYEPTVSKNKGSMKDYITFKISYKKFWDEPKLRDARKKIGESGTYNNHNTIDVHKSLIIELQ